jgi:hypothetical protein
MHFLTTNWLLILGIVALAWVGVRFLGRSRGHGDHEGYAKSDVNAGGHQASASGEGHAAQEKSGHKHGGCC